MLEIYQQIESAATSKNSTVLITGETGTGKEICAEAIHRESTRRDKPFIILDCGAFPELLVESQLFGHVKGAFTGAIKNRRGAAEQANGGTLFLDEIGELSLASQATLLRFIQTKTFHPVGSDILKKVDVRFICATNRDLLANCQAGLFRSDLFYRLDGFNINMPPLRDRGDDVLLLAEHFLTCCAEQEHKSFVGFTREIEAIFKGYDWRGNVRELQNVINKIVLRNDGKYVTVDMLPPPLDELVHAPSSQSSSSASAPAPAQILSAIKKFSHVEKETFLKAIEDCNGNVVQAAKCLGIGKTTLYSRLRAWGIKIKRTYTPR